MASTTLEEKINKIRQKNEEIRRRHEEVEADKQNAAKLNALVKMVPPTDWPERKEPPEFSNPPPPRSNGNSKQKVSTREYRGQQQQYHAGGGDGKKIHVFAEGDGPPPDPTYNFLADSEREERTREDSRDNDRFRGRGGPVRGASRRRGGGREAYSKEYRGSGPGPKDASKPEYEAWRAERNRIDEARISRQRTAEGNWRREWDNNKINVEEDEAGVTKAARLDIGDVVKKDHKEFDKWQGDGNDHDSPRGRGGKQYVSRGAPRGSHNNRVYQHSNSFEQFHGPTSPPATKPPVSPNGIDDRMVVATDKSIKVIVNHGTTVAKGPVMSVKVSPASIAGTGRVGPRQKPRILYSSQSEAETLGHEHEKFSSHKSSDDKANRVSFNRDIDEQQRYIPKSPHPQRKGESNSKSPYFTRKEFKYDSQQQRHGEMEPKSPYLPRKEVKDCPKSPHFQKKSEFTNRDSNVKQKHDKSATDSFKSTHPQRRTPEKAKHDSQKFPVLRKAEDPSAPKPQRINKRADKSRSFQHSNSKESQESCTNENNAPPTNFGTSTSEEASKNIANGDKTRNEANKADDICEIDFSENSVAVETIKKNQNGEENMSTPNIDSETLSPSVILEEVHKNVPDDTKLIDNSEPTTLTRADANEDPESVQLSDNQTEKELTVDNDDINITANSVIPNSIERKVDEPADNLKDIEAAEKLPEITSTVKEEIEVEIPTIIQESQSIDTCEIKDTEDKSDGELKKDQNSTPVAVPDSLEKIEEKTNTVKNELESEKKDEIPQKDQNSSSATDPGSLEQIEEKTNVVKNELESEKKDVIPLEPKEVANEIAATQDVAESTSLIEKAVLSDEIESIQCSEKKVSKNIDNPVIQDTEEKENTVI